MYINDLIMYLWKSICECCKMTAKSNAAKIRDDAVIVKNIQTYGIL